MHLGGASASLLLLADADDTRLLQLLPTATSSIWLRTRTAANEDYSIYPWASCFRTSGDFLLDFPRGVDMANRVCLLGCHACQLDSVLSPDIGQFGVWNFRFIIEKKLPNIFHFIFEWQRNGVNLRINAGDFWLLLGSSLGECEAQLPIKPIIPLQRVL